MLALFAIFGTRIMHRCEYGRIHFMQRSYKFAKGGTYKVSVESSNSNFSLVASLVRSHVSNEMMMATDPRPGQFCFMNLSDTSFGKSFSAGVGQDISGTVEEKGEYNIWWRSCNGSNLEDAAGNTYSITIQLRNPHTFLSLNEYPMVYGTPIVTTAIGVMIVVWLVNWIVHFSLENKLHLLFTIAFIFTFVYYILCCASIIKRHRSDDVLPLYMGTQVFRVIQETILLAVMTFAAGGWYIIRPTIKVSEIVVAVILTSFVTVPAAIFDYTRLSYLGDLLVIFGMIVGCVLFHWNLIAYANRATKEVKAHLVVIQEQGINPESTPIYHKFAMFQTLIMTVCCYFGLYFTRSIVTAIWFLPEWIPELTYQVFLSVFPCIVGWCFRMKKDTTRGYFMIPGSETGVRVFSVDDIDSMELQLNTDTQTEWQEGMELPSQPVIDFGNARLSPL